MQRRVILSSVVGLMALAAMATAPAHADVMNFTAAMNGASETPAVPSAGTGTVEAAYDTATKTLSWTVEYSGLTGDATAAHFHGPAKEGAKAPPVVPIQGALASPIKGTATLTDQQANDLQAGLWYFNVHTAKYPDGEIRGQLSKK